MFSDCQLLVVPPASDFGGRAVVSCGEVDEDKEWFLDSSNGKVSYDVEDSLGNAKSIAATPDMQHQ